MSYTRSQDLLNRVGDHFDDSVVEHLRRGQKFRLIGDNLNFKVKTKDVRQDRQDTTKNMFASAVILHSVDADLPQEPKIRTEDFVPQDILPNSQDLAKIRASYIQIVSEVVAEHIPTFSFLKDAVSKDETPFATQLAKKTEVYYRYFLLMNNTMRMMSRSLAIMKT